MEKIRYTNVPCGKKDWLTTKGLADDYHETWQTKITDPPEVYTTAPPTTEAELPPQTGDTPSQWDGGGPPWKEAKKTDTDKTDTGKTDTGKTDTGKTDTGKTDTGKTDTAKTDSGQTATDKKDATTDKKVTGSSSVTTPSGKKAPRKEVHRQGKTIARSRTDEQAGQGGGLSPEAATAIGIGIGMGLGGGFGGRGRMGGTDDRMGR